MAHENQAAGNVWELIDQEPAVASKSNDHSQARRYSGEYTASSPSHARPFEPARRSSSDAGRPVPADGDSASTQWIGGGKLNTPVRSAFDTPPAFERPLSCLSITRQSFSATNHQKCCFSTQDMAFSTMKIEKALDDNFDGDGKGKLQVFR